MSHQFSEASQEKLATVDDRLRHLMERAAERWNITVIEGHRSPRRQQQLFMAGKTKVRRSKHNDSPSRAIDVAPFPIDWDDTLRFYRFGEYVLGLATGMGLKVRWGGDWDGDSDIHDQSFNDLVHFELRDDDQSSARSDA